jgi:YNFM family putative membrane transporter
MRKKDLFIIIYLIVILLSVMYATQPLQPLLADEFNVSVSQASFLTAVIMFFLAIAPIVYGYILERICAKKILIIASTILLITNIFLGFSTSYTMFLSARIAEGIVIPAILTASMSILANIDKENIQRNMAIYVAATVFGGLVGRLVSGIIAHEFGWRVVFFSLSGALLLSIYLINKLSFEGNANLTKAKISDVLTILKDKRFVVVYSLMFSMFFVFAGVLNILPFRVKDLMPDVNEAQIGFLYLGYGMGILVSLYIKKIIAFLGSKIKTIIFGMIIFIMVIFSLFVSNIFFVFAMIFFLCLGMFTVHTVSTGLANSMKQSQKALTSGMYLTFYYIGGTFGSIIPVIVYENYGWNMALVVLIFVLVCSLAFVLANRSRFSD